MNYTDTQRIAINDDYDAALVSAAAGSGKTSVLAGRVARLICGGADIRHMLVMTFTNAAAAEMKSRIAGELMAAASGREDKRLMEQSELTSAADISTFHSFCAKVTRENYNIAEVSPNFKIMNDVEAASLKNEAARELFDLLYEKGDPDFLRLVRRFTRRGEDSPLARALLKIFDTMMGKPNPYGWALQSADTDIRVYMARLRAEYEKQMISRLGDALALMKLACDVSLNCGGKQADADCAVIAQLEAMLDCAVRESVDKARDEFYGFKIPNLLPKAAPGLKEGAGDYRSGARKDLKEFLEDAVYDDFILRGRELTEHTRADVVSMVNLIKLFDKLYMAKKNRRNTLDYEDLQHKALKVLEKCGGQYSERYTHVFVDEYQDTNPVQEEIIKRIHTGGNCLFMVGDIKQSIYKFRLADPEIFRQRAEALGGEASGCLIAMNDNFRSADNVISAVNFVMDRIMSEELGGVRYEGGEKLRGNVPGGEARILLCETSVQEDGEDEESEPLLANEAQARMIAGSIGKAFTTTVRDRDTGEVRQARYGDIAVLMRSRSGLTACIKRELDLRGIPAAVSIKEARDIPEIELFVNFLKIIQNPKQDIPLLSVLRSYIGRFDENDFAKMRLSGNDAALPFYAAAERYSQSGEDGTAVRLKEFYDEIESLSERCGACALADFIKYIAEKYGFYTYIMSVSGGVAKKQAFDALIALMMELVEADGNSIYKLLEALDQIKKRDGCYVQYEDSPKGTDIVRIMTIHGSKGLEFPIVYVAGLNKKFNTKDTREDFLTHNDYGLTARYVDDVEAYTVDTLERRVVSGKIASDNRSEELRMLYVAMTRARDALYLCGCVDDILKQNKKWDALSGRYNKASSMLDWIMAANAEEPGIAAGYVQAESAPEAVHEFDFEALVQKTIAEGEPRETITIQPFPRVPAKVSVSAVKRAGAKGIRSFLRAESDDGEITGAELGTLVHGMMERLVMAGGGFDSVASGMLENHLITDGEYAALLKNRAMAEGFLGSGIYSRMKKSDKILLEQQFNIRIKANEIGYGSDEYMLVQGILDAAFMEDGAWVLLDYKSDRVTADSVERAALGYKIQIDLYARALWEITGIQVKERYLYFLRPGIEARI